ncbi:unspecific monooxygenase [Saccharothrix tamanrassetensis]|uniref:Unspecific monooxygenase n=1 Tax=Saccharothrix tamanrassetensis TaxID=1051531 RepID=A0A841C8R4_9PSEU|nr:cytochrome P450 [Saccharothrix tamanrassetensis]MBB5954932.1 unspecific monooxygenase [Saccharothrix tamanrassetensis]
MTDTAAIPHPPWRVPFVGDVVGTSLRTPVQDTMKQGSGLGPIFTRRFLNREVVFVAGAALTAELADESRFAKHLALGVEELRGIGGDGLFTAYNEEPNWKAAHDVLLPAFTQGAMRAYHPAMVDVTAELVGKWDRGGEVDVSADMTKLTLETIGRVGFGYSFESFRREQAHPFVSAMIGSLRYAQRKSFQFPWARKLFGRAAEERNRADVAYLAQVVDEVIRSRRGSEGTDLLGLMLSSGALDEVNIRNQVITFLIAGHETTSGALSFALYYLSRNPSVFARAREEVDRVWGSASEPSFEQVTKLRYVRRVLDESLRLWPTAPGYAREARVDTVLGKRYRMRAGQWALVMLPLVHRDPSVWPEPERFDPDRFAPEQVKARPAHVYKPFGTGERACIGRQFAVHEATLALGTVLRRYDLAADPGYRLRVKEMLTLKPAGFSVTPRRR